MTPKRTLNGPAGAAQDVRMRPAVKWGAIGVLLFCVLAVVWHFRSGSKPVTQAPALAETAPEPAEPPAPGFGAPLKPEPEPTTPLPTEVGATPIPGPTPGATSEPAPAQPTFVDPSMGTLLAGLNSLAGTNAALTAESVAAWRTNFAQLVQSGPAAVPALRAFLEQKSDANFTAETWQALGYSSPRIAAIDALRQIGGPDAIAVMESLLGTTQSPREIATLARNLEEAQPGVYREQSLAAARTGLQNAAQTRDPNLDVAPLFEVFQHYGDASVIPDLERAMGTWKYYSMSALAGLPEGAGIPAILKMTEGGSGGRVVALEMVAQLATRSQEARDFLLAQATGNNIPANLWPYLTGPLSGDRYFPSDSAITQYPHVQYYSDVKSTRIPYGNQNLYKLPGHEIMNPEEVNARVALVDQLLATASDPAAVKALQNARNTLARRAVQAAGATQSGTGAATTQ